MSLAAGALALHALGRAAGLTQAPAWASALVAAVLICGFEFRRERLRSAEERRFWRLLSCGIAAWLLPQFLPRWPALAAALNVVSYSFVLLALVVRPHLEGVRASTRLQTRLRAAGTAVFALGLLAYLLGVGPPQGTGSARVELPALALYVALDAVVLIRLWALRRDARAPRWRAIYGWLGLGTALWLVADTIGALGVAGLIAPVAEGGRWPLAWLLFAAPALVAARLREHPFADAADEAALDARGESVQQTLASLWTDPTFGYAAAVPVVHLALWAFGALDPETRTVRDLVALAMLVVLGGIAVASQKLVEAETRETTLRLARQASRDELTGLPNRAHLRQRLGEAIEEARESQERVALLFLDVDRFKNVNDSLGHAAGDELLRAVAQSLLGVLRQGDALARFSGDEFAIVACGIRQPADASRVAEKVLAVIRKGFAVAGRELVVTASIGISLFPDHADAPDTLIRNADAAKNRAKGAGRDTFRLYTPTMSARAMESLDLESALRKALARDEFVLHYQPIVDLATLRVERAEALLRWRHPTKGLLPPAAFIDVAESAGVIGLASPWILRTACAQAVGWGMATGRAVGVAVNLSAASFHDPTLVSHVGEALSASGLLGALLELEITESLAMRNAEATIETLKRLKALGVRIAIDDFGTGYSSLAYLKRFPLDVLKIDRSFVKEVDTDPADAAIAATVIAMARTLGLDVVAEGVERESQLVLLRGHGCRFVQGYLLSRPVAADAFLPLLSGPITAPSAP
jgi:diguanylate cyclase (GGDEF)-like protein